MRKRFLFLAAVALTVLGSSCTTKQQGAELATASALVVGLPLIPFAGAYHAYHIASGDWRSERKAEKQLREILDPVYEKRIKLIQQRDPTADAKQAWLSGSTAFLPSLPRGNIFPGLEHTEFNLKEGFGAENYKKVLQSELLNYLETLMGKDPVHVQSGNVNYFTETYKQFIHVSWRYREAFNKVIYARLQSSTPER